MQEAFCEKRMEVNKLIEKTNLFLENSKNQTNSYSYELNDNNNINSLVDKKVPSHPMSESNRKPSSNKEKINDKAKIKTDFRSLDCSNEEKPCDISKINKVANTSINNTLNNNFTENSLLLNNNIDESFKSNYSNGNLYHNSSMNQRLLEKIKLIKVLETDLKEKNSLIDKLNNKIEKQNVELSRLKSKSTNDEVVSNLNASLSQLKSLYDQKQKEVVDTKDDFLELINEFKEKIQNLMKLYNSSLDKIKELDNKVYELNKENKSLIQNNQFSENNKINLDNQMKNLKDNFEESLREKQKIQEKYKVLATNSKSLVKMILNNRNSFQTFDESVNKLYYKLKDLFVDQLNSEYDEK